MVTEVSIVDVSNIRIKWEDACLECLNSWIGVGLDGLECKIHLVEGASPSTIQLIVKYKYPSELILTDHLEVDEMNVDGVAEEDGIHDEPVFSCAQHWVLTLSLVEISPSVDGEYISRPK